MINPVEVTFMVPEDFERSFERLARRENIDVNVLKRLAFFDFLVKFTGYEGDYEQRDRYDYLYKNFKVKDERRKLTRTPSVFDEVVTAI